MESFPVVISKVLAQVALLAEAAPGAASESPLPFWLPFVIIGILFYFMMIRPERKKRQETDDMIAALKKNDRILTIGGIYGTVVSAAKGSDDVTIRIDESNNTKIRIQRSSVKTVVTDKAEVKSEEK